MEQIGSLSHTKWECKYHVVWIPKCRKSISVRSWQLTVDNNIVIVFQDQTDTFFKKYVGRSSIIQLHNMIFDKKHLSSILILNCN